MYRCGRCGSDIDDGFDRCWNCNEAVPDSPSGQMVAIPEVRAAFRSFQGTLPEWKTVCAEAAMFATSLGPDRVINLSQSTDQGTGVVTVWYWDDGAPSSEGDFTMVDPG